MLKRLGDIYAFLLGWPAAARLNKGLFYLSSRALGLYNYASPLISGENRTIKERLDGIRAPVVFDVGANNGDWLAIVLKANEKAQVHAFEPQPSLAAHIAATYSNVVVNNTALGDAAGLLDLYDYDDHPGSQHATLLKGVIDDVHGGTPRHLQVPVITIDDYCRERQIPRIHFLKVDVEGFELAVLRGARDMISKGNIDAIQFEFNEMNVIGRTFLHDFMECLGETFDLYRILPHGSVPTVRNNHWHNEQYAYQNMLAIRRSRSLPPA